MLNRIGTSPSFKSTVVVNKENMTDKQKEIFESRAYRRCERRLSKNGCDDVLKIYSSKEEGEENTLKMDIIQPAGIYKVHIIGGVKLTPGDELADIYQKQQSYWKNQEKYDTKTGKYESGATLDIRDGCVDDYKPDMNE